MQHELLNHCTSLLISVFAYSKSTVPCCSLCFSSVNEVVIDYQKQQPLWGKQMSEIEETFQRISQRPNVTGIIVVNNEGTPIRSTIEDTAVQNQYAHLITALAAKARHCVRDLDPTNDLSFLRIRSKKNEIMVAPEKDFVLIVIQSVSDNM